MYLSFINREKQELLEMLNKKQRAIMNLVHIIDTSVLAEDVACRYWVPKAGVKYSKLYSILIE